MNLALMFTQKVVLILMVMISVAFFSLMERKALSYIHFRKGPNKVVLSGFFQPFADAIKLLSKDDSPVSWSNKLIYYFSPGFMFFLSLIIWSLFPFVWGGSSSHFSFLGMIVILGLSVYGIMLSGWSSNSSYGMLGSIRSVSQSISYEVVMSFVFLTVIFLISDLTLESLYKWKMTKIFLLCPFLFLITLISLLAELNRSPFDLAEGESELVAGYSVEYSGVSYMVIFLSENMMIFFSSFLITYLFINNLASLAKTLIFSFITLLICMIRGILPRIRYDMLMHFCWTWMMPMILLLFNLCLLLKSLI